MKWLHFQQNFKEEFKKLNRCQGLRNFFQTTSTIGQVQIELQQIESGQTPERSSNTNTNLMIRETIEESEKKSVVLVIHHHEEPQNTLYSCQMQ